MIPDRPLTKKFSLHEMLVSQTGVRMGFDEQFEPSPQVVKNLELLCINVLQPLRDALKYSVHVSSGYRCPRVNSSIGGASKSQHLFGQAADIQDFTNGNEYMLRKIIELKLPFDQMINEFGWQWVHVSFDVKRSRKQVLEATKNATFQTVYKPMNLKN